MNAKIVAIRAWADWRAALYDTVIHEYPGEDALAAMLRSWWGEQGFPAITNLSDEQADLVLAQIARLDWSCRPFEEAR